jgi:hypothetical protein
VGRTPHSRRIAAARDRRESVHRPSIRASAGRPAVSPNAVVRSRSPSQHARRQRPCSRAQRVASAKTFRSRGGMCELAGRRRSGMDRCENPLTPP